MVKVRGRPSVKEYMADLRTGIEDRWLPGAARAGGEVIAEDARARCESPLVASKIAVKIHKRDGKVVARIGIESGWPMHVGVWLEYGTAPHSITAYGNSLWIGGKPVGKSVMHPGARPFPFLRPALDAKDQDAFAAAQSDINSRARGGGSKGGDE